MIEVVFTSQAWWVTGWTLAHFLWVGSLIGLFAWLGRFCLRRASSAVRHAFALTCLVALAVAPFVLWASVHQQPPARRPSVGEVSAAPGTGATPIRAEAATRVPAAADPRQARTTGERPTAPPEIAWLTILVPVIRALPAFWLAAVIMHLLWVGLGVCRVARLLRDGQASEPPPEAVRLNLGWSHRLGLGRPTRLVRSQRVTSPVLLGIRRPAILLPARILDRLSPDHLEFVVLHELVHVQRRDNLVNLLQRIVESLWCLHPSVWLVSRWVRSEREQRCDEEVVARTGRADAYAETLLSLVEWQRSAPSLAVGMARAPLVRRVRRILEDKENTMQCSPKIITATAVGALAVLLMAAVPQSRQPVGMPGAQDRHSHHHEGVTDCTPCHVAGTVKGAAPVPLHKHPMPGSRCTDCHTSNAHQPDLQRVAGHEDGPPESCKNCHESPVQAMPVPDCLGCHVAHDIDIRPLPDPDCSACHDVETHHYYGNQEAPRDSCKACHKPEGQSTNVPRCADCHGVHQLPARAPRGPDCANCHSVETHHQFGDERAPEDSCKNCHLLPGQSVEVPQCTDCHRDHPIPLPFPRAEGQKDPRNPPESDPKKNASRKKKRRILLH